MKHIRIVIVTAVFMLSVPLAALAHDARPVAVTITEILEHVYQYSLRVPPTVEFNNQPELLWPDICSAVSDQDGMPGSAMQCPGGLEEQSLRVVFPLYNPSLSTFYRLTNVSGQSSTAMLSPTEQSWTVPAQPTSGNVASEYFMLGIEHIIGGADHLLFVLGLLVIAGTMKRILITVTGFTLAHSITLSLSSLGYVRIPIVPVEAVIALSILYLAFEISRQDRTSLSYRFPLIVSFGFGLLHGLGFASALGEIGLVPGEIVLSLLFFNLGVEAGQVLFILLVLALLYLATLVRRLAEKTASQTISTGQGLVARGEMLAAYMIGIPSAYWVMERTTAFLF